MIWLKKHWSIITILATLVAGVLYAGEEWGQYQNVKEAALEQKAFNDEFKEKFNDMNAKQERVDERTILMLKMLESIDKRLDNK